MHLVLNNYSVGLVCRAHQASIRPACVLQLTATTDCGTARMYALLPASISSCVVANSN